MKASGWILTAGLMVGGAAAGAQMFGPGGPMGQPFGGPTGQVPPEIARMQKAQEELMKEAAPELFAFQKKLRGVEAEVAAVVKGFAGGEIDKETAKERLLPLLKEQREIREDPDFQAEQRLAQVYFSSPEYRKKMEAIMRKFAPKPPAPKVPAPPQGKKPR